MADTNVLTELTGRVAVLTINRPEKRNALNSATRQAFLAALAALGRNPEVRVVIVTGAGDKAFVAGADIGEFEGRSPVDQFRVMREPTMFEAVERFARPVIAAINGFCLGGEGGLAWPVSHSRLSCRQKFRRQGGPSDGNDLLSRPVVTT
jgi:enoyl-CoA hydratase